MIYFYITSIFFHNHMTIYLNKESCYPLRIYCTYCTSELFYHTWNHEVVENSLDHHRVNSVQRQVEPQYQLEDMFSDLHGY